MTDIQQKSAAKKFMADWTDRGNEKQETQLFWIGLLRTVYGVENPEEYIRFEVPVNVDDMKTGKTTTKFIDACLPETRVLIEQKGADIDLKKGYKQSDGSLQIAFVKGILEKNTAGYCASDTFQNYC